MRKFYAAIALCITLIGTLSPVFFSVNGLQKNIANAGTLANTFFGRGITVENIAGDTTSFNMSSSVRYNVAGYSQGGTLGLSAVALHYKVVKLNDQSVVVDGEFDETDYFKNNVEKAFTQKIAMPPDGTYLGWFYEDILLQTENVDSSKVKFVVSGGKITSQSIDASVLNQDSGVKVSFSIPQGFVDPTKPTEIKITGAVFYKDASQPVPSTEDAPVNISWVLTDTNGTEISRKKITGVSGKINEQQGIGYSFIINNLTQGTAYKVHLEENEIKTNGDTVIPSASIPFIAGVEIDNAAIQQQIQQQNADNALADLKNSFGKDGTDGKDGLDCSLWDMDFFCYLVKFTVYITTFVPDIIATVTGLLSDFFLKFAMDPKMYGLSYTEGLGSMIYGAWSIVRDFANIGFIFALFTAAFMLILNKNEINNVQFEPKKVVVRVVIMALLVNFSLMFCRLIIQSADVFSHILYNKIVVTVKGDTAISNFLTKAEVKSVSFGLVTNTNPQRLFMNQGVDKDDPGSYTAYLAIGFITFFIYLIYIYLFVSMTLIWMGRIFGAWIAMILSPIAFVSWAIPFIENDKHIGFTNWLENFVKLAFLVPIYLFFVYISVTVLNLQNLTNGINDPDAGWMFSVIVIIIKVLLPLLAATFILMKGKTIAYDMSGEIGKVAGKFTGMATSLALGAATGGSALLARQTLGRAGSAMANKYASDTSVLGKGMNSLGNKMGAATFDVRNNKTMMKGFEGFTGAAGEKVDLGKRGLQEKGGFLESGDFTQIMEDRKARIADEKATKLEQEALARANNPQSRENIAKRNTERQIAANKKAKEAEEAKIALETGTQPADPAIDTIIDAEKAKIAANQTESNKLQTETMKINQEEFNEKSKINKERAAVAEELKKIGSVSITDPQYAKVVDLQNKSKELDAKEKAVTDKAIAAKAPIIARRDTLAQENDKLTQKVTKLTSLKGKTIEQAKHENEIAKMEAANSDEGKKLAEVEKKIQDAQKEVNKLSAEEKTLRSEGKIAEADALREKIADEKSKYTTRKNKQGVVIGKGKLAEELDAAKNEFNDKHDIKRVEDSLKDAEKAYKASQNTRLSGYDKVGKDLDIQLKKDEYLIQQRRKEILGAHADAMDKALITNKNIAGGFAETVGVITNGRLMGGSVNNAGNVGATAARNRARTGK